MESSAIDCGTAHAIIAATSGARLVPLVRVTAKAGWHAKFPFDLGAMGGLLPDDDANPRRPGRSPSAP